jgi:glyoxylase-like metal-dependent hydrolase (beta-lactamase superfamily II)
VAGLVAVTETTWLLRLAVVNVYILRTTTGIALIDTGPLGAHEDVLDAVAEVGASSEDVRWIVLTHSHKDHAGSAAAIVERTGAAVLAGATDAPVIAGTAPEPAAVITREEQPFYERVARSIPPAPPVRVDLVLHDGDSLGWGLPRAVVIDAPGHTPGSIAVHLPDDRLLFTGDNIAALASKPILGPFNVARDDAIDSFRKLARFDVDIACFGHGDPIVSGARSALTRAALRL